jgi:hypothetical protein
MRQPWIKRKSPPGEDGGAGSGSAGGAGGASGAGGAGGAAAATKPEGLDDKYWDAAGNSVKTPDLLKDFGELTKYRTESEAAKAALIADPAKIDWTIDVKAEDGTAFEINPEDPLFKAMAPELVGLPQTAVTKLATTFGKVQAAARNEARKQLDTEMKALGGGDAAKGLERIDAAQKNLAAVLGDRKDDKGADIKGEDVAKRFISGLTTAADVEVIEKLLESARDPNAVRGRADDRTDDTNPGKSFYGSMKKAG